MDESILQVLEANTFPKLDDPSETWCNQRFALCCLLTLPPSVASEKLRNCQLTLHPKVRKDAGVLQTLFENAGR